MDKKTRVLLVGGSFCNKGAEAMVLSCLHEIDRRLSNVEFMIASYAKTEALPWGHHEHRIGDRNIGYTLVRNPTGLTKLTGLIGLSCSDFWHGWKAADLILDISGFAMSDQRPLTRRIAYAYEIATARWKKKLIFLMPQAFGPFKYASTRLLAKLTLPLADTVCIRDQVSLMALEHLGITGRIKKLYATSDCALLLPPLQQQARKPKGNASFGIVPNIRLYEKLEHSGDANAYIDLLCDLARIASERYAVQPALIIHEEYPHQRDDRWIAQLCCDRLKGELHLPVIHSKTAVELRAVTEQLDFLVASRYHALIGAIALAKPFFALGWAHKYTSLAEDLDMPELAWAGQAFDPLEIIRKVELLWKARIDIAAKIEQKSKLLCENAAIPFDLIVEAIRHKP